MWLVDRQTDGTGGGRIAVPDLLRETLVRWYVGQGSRADEDAAITLVQQARIGARWLACDCLPAGTAPAILTPAFLSEAETYYLRRLTSANRPEHHPDCPFFRDQVTNRLTEVRGAGAAAEPPSGYFAVLKPAPEKLAQRPEEDATDDRTRQGSVPRLARLLWRLLDVTGLNRCEPAGARDPEHSINDEFRRLSLAASRIEVAPGIELGRVLWTHGTALHSRRVQAALHALEDHWPEGHARQGFLILFSGGFRGQAVELAGCDPIRVANRVQSPSTRADPIDGPYLVIIVVGEYPEARGFAPLRAYAQPIYSGHRFLPIETAFERPVLRCLLRAQRQLERADIGFVLQKPVFDRLTPLGACRPDFLLEARSRRTGEIKEIAIEALAGGPSYLAMKASAGPRLRALMPVLDIRPADVAVGRVGEMLAAVLDL